MSVTVWFVTGDPKAFRDVDAASLETPLFVLSKWNAKKRNRDTEDSRSRSDFKLTHYPLSRKP